MKKYFFVVTAVIIAFMLGGCGKPAFKITESGLTYKVHRSNNDPKAAIDNIVKVDMAYRFPEDSVLFSSIDFNEPMYITILPSEYQGDIYEGFTMMAVDDSLTFKLDASQFFTVTLGYNALPGMFQQGDSIFVDVVMRRIFTKEEFDAYQEEKRQALIEEQEKLALQEEGLMQQYLTENNITAQPEESGLIIIVTEQGTGPKPTAGQVVTVHYTGKLLDGTVFDSSVDRGEPIEFQIGVGQVISGWDEGLSKLNVGSKATFIIPSHLAYGNQQRGPHIKPFSTLVFEVELINAR